METSMAEVRCALCRDKVPVLMFGGRVTQVLCSMLTSYRACTMDYKDDKPEPCWIFECPQARDR